MLRIGCVRVVTIRGVVGAWMVGGALVLVGLYRCGMGWSVGSGSLLMVGVSGMSVGRLVSDGGDSESE